MLLLDYVVLSSLLGLFEVASMMFEFRNNGNNQ